MNEFDRRLKRKLMEVFRFSICFFEQHRLHYYACGGTALGAVRHQGIIPWDDDIDLYMPRKDYDKLLSLSSRLEGTHFRIVSLADKGYYLPYAKIVDIGTTLWEMKKCPFLLGVFVDVFPLDYFSVPKEKVAQIQWADSRLFSAYRRHLFRYDFQDLARLAGKGKLLPVARYLLDRINNMIGGEKRLLRTFEAHQREYASQSEPDSKYCVCVTQWEGKVFETEWFKKSIPFPFEDTEILVPAGYDAYLTLLYGDYMTPPPSSQRVSEHLRNFRYYINLEERLDIGAVKQRLQLGEFEK